MPRSDHADAILTRLRDAPGGRALVVFDGAVPSKPTPPPRPFLVVHFRAVSPDKERAPELVDIEEQALPLELYAYVHAAGDNAESARKVADRGYDQLMGWTPTISGRECWPIRHDDSQPSDPDETTASLVVTQVDVYRFLSAPA